MRNTFFKKPFSQNRKHYNLASVNYRPETATPLTLISVGEMAVTDPRFNKRGNNDTHDGIAAPDKYDLVGNSRYANYCRSFIDSVRAKQENLVESSDVTSSQEVISETSSSD